MKFKSVKKLMAAALLGAFAVGSSAAVWSAAPAFASAEKVRNEVSAEHRGNKAHHGVRKHKGMGGDRKNFRQKKFNPQEAAENMAKTFDLDSKEILAAIEEKRDFRDIMHAAVVAKASHQPFAHVIRRKTAENSWGDVEAAMRVSPEMIKEVRRDVAASWMSEKLKVEKEQVKSLINEGYKPKDISFAAVISRLSNNDMKKILLQKKLNNTWQDVAKENNVDEKDFKKAMHELWWQGRDHQGKGNKEEVHHPMPLPVFPDKE